ncbi:3-deoxy-D-manno-octulosonic acid transferase [Pedobacter glucosidilyticus]|uniref:3-deoxy-D-manno-octulosonic acid transferase n=1 Tax=Pedobacter glucosidilyticus TaxID=1122941 RepID=UPI0026EBF8BB|nr:glycosyltransferase N-terminal domain-containing protein [Pedobacter glucosidilyticus]
MPLIYNIGIKFYYLFIHFASFFNIKAKKWIDGRKNWREKYKNLSDTPTIWFHFASLGEFEQGKPLLEAVRNKYQQQKIVITFFSPSGYEIRKNSPLGDYILYLPLDTAKNAQDFIRIFKPSVAFFNKYEYWYHFFKALNQHHIPLYITSAIFRPQQIFFKFYGGFNRQILSYVTHFFTQNKESDDLLSSIGLRNFTLCGDTRFDSVNNLAQKVKELPFVKAFKNESKLLIAGSTWPDDEKLLSQWFIKKQNDWKILFAPHEIKPEKIKALQQLFNDEVVIKHSEIADLDALRNYKILIIDNIGMLSSLYPYGEIAYIGGGFGVGIHNTLEAATWGLPVIFGPNYQKFQEAKDLIKNEAGFSIKNQEELNIVLTKLTQNEVYCINSGKKAQAYVKENVGATALIMKKVFD